MKTDVIIIGGGPAGLTAGIFAQRAGLKTILFEKLAIGGQAALTYEIANYPGFENISGFDLMEKIANQATSLGLEIKNENVLDLSKTAEGFIVKTNKKSYEARKVIIATGNKVRKLDLPNEQKFTGKGVSYCASCDGGFFKNKNVAVVGGGMSAISFVTYLSKVAKTVYMLVRSDKFRANDIEVKKIKQLKNVKILLNTKVKKLVGEDALESVMVDKKGEEKTLQIEGLFVAIGHEPDINFVNINLDLDAQGYIKVDLDMKTNVKNLFACGDITSKKFKQIISACADGAIAGNSCIGD